MYQNSRPYKSKPIRKIAAPKGLFVAAFAFAFVIIAGGLLVMKLQKNEPAKKNDKSSPTATVETFDKTQFSLTDPTSMWLVVNKKRPLDPKTYAPNDLRTPDMQVEGDQQVNDQTATALEALNRAAAADGISVELASGYRSYDTQVTIYASEVRAYGQAQADRESARPGHSEHQTGWAADLGTASGTCELKACFADTKEGKWLGANAYKYGFIIRYPDGKEKITGYLYEPWHVRYVGTDLSTEMHNQKIQTLEEFFNLPPAPQY
jgi:D-alanyl-D-alanine carboxypeptidase